MADSNELHNTGDNNINIQGVTEATIIINQSGEKIIIPYQLTSIPYITMEDVIGREEKITQLYQLLHQPNGYITAVVNGLGGIGKTTLAQAYVTRFEREYAHKLWITQNPGNTFIQDVTGTTLLAKNLNIAIESRKIEDVFESIFARLNQLQINKIDRRPNLMIIDNADEHIIKYRSYLPQPPNWHVLLTSRSILRPFQNFQLDFLSENEACTLFRKHYKKLTNEQVADIVRAVDCHTLTLSILAQSALENDWTYIQVKTAISENREAHITHEYTRHEPVDKIKTFISRIFNFSSLNEYQLFILSYMALIPSEFISLEDLKILLQYEKLEWKDEFVHTVKTLYRTGWLLKGEDKGNRDQYKLHIIIGDIIKETTIINKDSLERYLDILANLFFIDVTKQSSIDRLKWITYGQHLLRYLKTSIESQMDIIRENRNSY